MIRSVHLLILLSVCVLFLFVAGCTSSTLTLTEKENGASVKTPIGTVITIDLPANPTTGYDWYPQDVKNLDVYEKDYHADQNQHAEGSGGNLTMKVKAKEKGTYLFTATYKRPWEPFENGKQYLVNLTFI